MEWVRTVGVLTVALLLWAAVAGCAADYEVTGIGGAGGMFTPMACPTDPDFMLLSCDMSGAYRSLDGSKHWELIHCSQLNNSLGCYPLFLKDAILWVSGRAWAMWVTFIYFSAFVIIRYFWLDQAFFQFKKTHGLFDGSFSIAPLMAVILVVLMAAIVFFDQFIVLRLRAKTYPATTQDEPPAETKDEVQQIQENYGTTPVRHLDAVGIFEVPTLAAHCVYLDKGDIEVLAEKKVEKIISGEFGVKIKSLLDSLKIQMIVIKESLTIREVINMLNSKK